MTVAKPKQPSIFSILGPYRKQLAGLIALAIGSNALTLLIPKFLSRAISAYTSHTFVMSTLLILFSIVAILIFVLTYAQNIVQTYLSERVARDMRQTLAHKISGKQYADVEAVGAGKLLTTLTSDIDSIKLFVAQAIVSLISSLVIIIGASILLLTINWRLALVVLTIIPLIGGTFFYVLRRVRKLFLKSREIIDWLNRVINESILAAPLIRVLHSESAEDAKFAKANTDAKNTGLSILRLFTILIPIITFFANIGMLVILVLGGHFIITGTLSLGDFAAFMSYMSMLIFPILIIGFVSNVIAQATASYGRVIAVLTSIDTPWTGTLTTPITGQINLDHVSLTLGGKPILKDITLSVRPGSRVAIVGPTAAGKTQLMYLIAGLSAPTSGQILFDNQPIAAYDEAWFHKHVGMVFQDSSLFQMSIRENIALRGGVADADLALAMKTSELSDFLDTLPDGLDTMVSERGTSLSGGQKQRLMLARALAQNPTILLLDDFTARVDAQTEQKILGNIATGYRRVTLISITQKIASIEHFDQIILLMEGECIAVGTHTELMAKSPEYVQLYNSQQSMSHYE